jgi:hypothetical protein
VHQIHEDFNNKRFCTATFIDISQAFDKVWNPGLLYKLKQALPHPMYSILQSYLTDIMYQVRYQEEYTSLYTIFTADLPVTEQTLAATYADDKGNLGVTLRSHHRNSAPSTAFG